MTTAVLPPVTLVLGGAASGKTAWAETLVIQSGLQPVYVATAEPLDEEMMERISRHRSSRHSRWTTIEAPRELAAAIVSNSTIHNVLLIDCLTLWLNNMHSYARSIETETLALTAALSSLPGPVVLVSNELGQGLVPIEKASRHFRDDHGRLNQVVAGVADCVVLVVAGMPLWLKGMINQP